MQNKTGMNMDNVMTQAENGIEKPENNTRKLSEVMDDVEVGMILIVHSVENKSTIGGHVKKKLLKHNPNTHEEFYDIELDVEGNTVPLNPYENYYVLRLVSTKPGKDFVVCNSDNEPEECILEEELDSDEYLDQLEEKIEQMIERYGLKEDEPIYNSFYKMVDHWDARTEDERESMAMALERFIDYNDIYTILRNIHDLVAYMYRLLIDVESYRMALERVGR